MHPDLIFTLVPITQNLGIDTGHKHKRFDLFWFCSNTVAITTGHEMMYQLWVVQEIVLKGSWKMCKKVFPEFPL